MNSGDVRQAIRLRFAAPEHAVVFEVAQGTGSEASRHLDAVAMNLWPSRGLAIHGIEIKVGRRDWRRELNNPAKAEVVATFCDFFWVAAPKGIVPCEEVPAAWGLIEVLDGGKSVIAKQAIKTEASPVTRSFLAACMRAGGRPADAAEVQSAMTRERKKIDDEFAGRLEREIAAREARRIGDAECWRELVTALGEDPVRFWEDRRLIAAVKLVMKSGLADGRIEYVAKELRSVVEKLDATLMKG